MPATLTTLRSQLNKALTEGNLSQSDLGKFWPQVAENWHDKEKLIELLEKVEKKKESILIKRELRELRDAGKINPNLKLNQSNKLLADIYNTYHALNFDDDLIAPPRPPKPTPLPVITHRNNFKNVLHEIRLENDENDVEVGYASFRILNYSHQLIHKALKEHHGLKVVFSFELVMQHKDVDNQPGEQHIFPHTLKPITILNPGQVNEAIANAIQRMKDFIPELETKNTGQRFLFVKSIDVKLSKYAPLRGGSFIQLDEFLTNKKCCINIQNNDDKCLMYCVLYHFNQDKLKKNPQRVSLYNPFLNQFDFSSISFPATLHEVKKVEAIIDCGINVFCYDSQEKLVWPILNTDRRDNKIMNLLMIKDGNNEHYVYIKKLDVLVTGNRRAEDGTHVYKLKYRCTNCLHGFTTQLLLNKHREDGCDLFEPTKTELPKMIFNEDTDKYETPTIQFRNHVRKFKAPVVIYADFETLVQPIEHKEHNYEVSSTTKIFGQEPCGYSFNVVSDYPELNFGLKLFRGDNAVIHFLHQILRIGDKVREVLDTVKPMIITPEQEIEFQSSEVCHICNEKINDSIDKLQRVRDHDHISGLYRGCAHQCCNVNFNYKNFKIPTFIHNLKGFDGHLIINRLSDMNFSEIGIIAQNFEKYMTFSFGEFRFLDSFAFLSSSLDTLASNLLKDGKDNFKHTLSQPNLTDEQIDLLLSKGVYPYEYMDCNEKFNDTELPPIEKFYSTLSEEDISDEDYNHAQNVWNKFNIRNMGEYHDLYLKTDVLLLSDVFESFRNTAMKHYELDPANGYFTLPNFAWDAMLKKSVVKLEQLTDIDMYLFCEKGLRGGTSMISHRYARANNKYMKEYKIDETTSYIVYLDANNLYGHAMIQKLPTGKFLWYSYFLSCKMRQVLYRINNRSYSEENPYHQWINETPIDGKYGHKVECDLHYPKELHDVHNSYPLAVESKSINKSELSPYQLNQLETYEEKHNESMKKLIPNFNDKERYVCDIRNLKYYIEKGLVVTKIHRVLKFEQSDWLAKYINFNTERRVESRNDFEKDFFKLMNNAVFGKTMENMRNRVKIDLVTDAKTALKKIAKPQFEDCKIYSNNLVAIKQLPKVVKLNKPIYVGLSVLDLSKLHMYQFHYDYIVPKYGDKQQLLFTDTDSLCYHIETEDIYKDMKDDSHLFDMAGYHMDGYRSCDKTNNKVIGKFKDETEGTPIVEFCGLRSKMYSIKLDESIKKGDNCEKKTGKGIKKSALKNKISHEDYKRCLFGTAKNDQRQLVSFNNMRSVDHKVFGYQFTRIGLSCSNDKQYLLDDGITSFSYGHYRITK